MYLSVKLFQSLIYKQCISCSSSRARLSNAPFPPPVSAGKAAQAVAEAGVLRAHQFIYSVISWTRWFPQRRVTAHQQPGTAAPCCVGCIPSVQSTSGSSAAPGVSPGWQPAEGLQFQFPQFLGLLRLGFGGAGLEGGHERGLHWP